MEISDAHIAHLVDHGYALVENFLTPRELEAARTGFPRLSTGTRGVQEITGHQFPYDETIFNHITAHPDWLGLGRKLLSTNQLATYGSLVWYKRDGTPTDEQQLHVDFPNNTLTYPRDDGTFRHLAAILYLSDVETDLGPTRVLSRRQTGEGVITSPMAPRSEFPEWYRLERTLDCPAGSLFVYSMKTFHRGSAITRPGGRRLSQHLHLFAAANRWMGTHHAMNASSREMAKFISEASPAQRHTIGWPEPGHPFWNQETRLGVAARYPKLDLAPYLSAC